MPTVPPTELLRLYEQHEQAARAVRDELGIAGINTYVLYHRKSVHENREGRKSVGAVVTLSRHMLHRGVPGGFDIALLAHLALGSTIEHRIGAVPHGEMYAARCTVLKLCILRLEQIRTEGKRNAARK